MRISTFLIAAGVSACLAGPTLAQPPEGGRRFGPGMGGVMSASMLAGNPSVQEELKLTDEQKEKLREAQRSVREKMGDLREMEPEERREKMKEINDEADKALKGVLKEDQMKRLIEIRWQQAPLGAFAGKEFEEGLKLTDDQKEKLKGITEEMGKDMREIRAEMRDNPREGREKMEALRKETKDKSLAVLTAEQKASYEKLVGKPFELKMEMRGPGGDGKGKEKRKEKDGEKKKPPVDD